LLLEEFTFNWRSGWKNAKLGDIIAYQSVADLLA